MRAGLDASTVTPGSTAPDASLTFPAIVPSACALLSDGMARNPRVRSRAIARSRMLVLRGNSQEVLRIFSLYESLFLERREIYASGHAVSRITSPKSRVGRDLPAIRL